MPCMQCVDGYMVTLKYFDLLIFVWIQITSKKQKRHVDEMNFDRSKRLPNLILFILVLNFFFRKKGKILELCDFKIGGCLRILVADRQLEATAV